MKKLLIRVFSVILTVCFVISLVACGNGGGTETKTETGTETQTETKAESETPTPPEDETNNRTESSVCFVGTDEVDFDAVFFDSLEEAYAAYPDGAEIKLCCDLEIGELTLPDTGLFSLNFNYYTPKVTIHDGFVFEAVDDHYVTFIYYPTLEDLMLAEESRLHKAMIWCFSATGTLTEAGKYLVTDVNHEETDAEPEYAFAYQNSLDDWGKTYVAETGGRFYTSLQDAIDNVEAYGGVVLIFNIADHGSPDDVYELPSYSLRYRISYRYFMVEGSFAYGATYDDDVGGYCFYSNLEHLTGLQGLANTHMWVWSDWENLKPGKYLMLGRDPDMEDVYDDESGLYTTFSMGGYTLVWVDEITKFPEEMHSFEGKY